MSNWPDLAGRIEGETHVLPIRIYFEDTDFAGYVYHANFLKFCERGRSDFIRLLGIEHQGLASPEAGEPAVFVVRRIGGRIATRGDRHAAIVAGKMADLIFPAGVVVEELVQEDERRPVSCFLVVDLDAVVFCKWHQFPSPACGAKA